MITLARVHGELAILFAEADKNLIEQMMGRSLNTWEPQPPKALLDVYDQLRGQEVSHARPQV